MPAPAPSPQAALRAKLKNWFTGSIAGKKIAWVGDSTTLQISPVSQGGAAGFNDWFENTYVKAKDGRLAGTVNVWQGFNGYGVNFFLKEPSGTALPSVIAQQADLYVFSFGINDVRVGEFGAVGLANNLRTAINAIRAAVPKADFVLRMPNSFLTTNLYGQNYVRPNELAQVYTDSMRDAYRSLANEWPNVAMYDSQARLFGEICQANSDLMSDQIHPSLGGYLQMIDQIVDIIGTLPVPAPVCN